MSEGIVVSVVDDDASAREGVMDLVETLGFTVMSFASAEDFQNSDGPERTSCLIVDMHMKGMTGLDLHRALSESGRRIPTIMITGYPDDKIRARALSAGVIGYLAKPFAEADFIACIRAALGDGARDL